MQQQQLTYLLQHPEAITAAQTDDLALKIEEFPYFQPLRALYIKGLKLKESYKYNTELKITAAYTTNRSVLFDYITASIFNQNEISKQIKQNSEAIKTIEINEFNDISVTENVNINEVLKTHLKAEQRVLDPNLFVKKPEFYFDAEENIEYETEEKNKESLEKELQHKTETPENRLNIGKPLTFDKTENHSFTEWLKITSSYKPIKRTANIEDQSSPPLEGKLAIIDRFLKKNPKIKPVSNKPTQPKLILVEGNSDTIMTETLARIYLEQNNYDKAIQAYRILSLKYPEKSGFFADQIKRVQILQKHKQ